VPNIVHMKSQLGDRFREAVELATATLGDVADGMERGYRTIHAYLSGNRRVTADAALKLATYLEERSRALRNMASALRAAAKEENRRKDGHQD
jgi:plasmid maintenance system antidote protein VapI